MCARSLAQSLLLVQALYSPATRGRIVNRDTPGALQTRLLFVDSVFQDLRYAWRSLAGHPSFTAMALLALVVGIGLNTGLFTAINALWARPWDVPSPERVVNAYASNARLFRGIVGFPLAGVRYLNDNSRTVVGVFASRAGTVQVADGESTDTVDAQFVSGNFFTVLQVPPALGRAFREDEDVPGPQAAVAVLSHHLWTQRYAADPAIVGRTVNVDGVSFTVIGVATETFAGTIERRSDLWLPLAALRLVRAVEPEFYTDPTHCCSEVGARLRPGVSRERAEAEWNTLYREYLREVGFDPVDVVLTGTAMLDHPQRRQQVAPVLAIVVAAFGSVLLLACANVSNLLLARAASRRSEIAIRAAIGAGGSRLVRQLLTESLLLAAVASALALPIASVLPALALRFMGQTPPTNLHLTLDAHVVLFAIAVAVVAAVAFGLAPALRGTNVGLGDAMKQRSAQATPRFALRGVLLGLQVAISVALLVAAALLARGIDHARSIDLGFRTDGISVVKVTLPANAYDPVREQSFFDDLLARLRGAENRPAAISWLPPLGDRREFTGAQCAPQAPLLRQFVDRGYFDVLQIPIVGGRNFLPEDRASGAVVVNESFARLCWPDRSPVGLFENIGGQFRQIVGVVRDAQVYAIGPVQPIVFADYVPDAQVVRGSASLLVPTSLEAAAASAVRAADTRATVETVTLEAQVGRALGDTAGIARVAAALGFIALLLATVGVYGVISYSVEQQRREIGVRLALGARPSQVVALMLRRTAPALGVGLAAGLVLAGLESLVLESQLYGLSPLDPPTYGGVLMLLALAAVAASALPARRAARTDPNAVLHYE